MATKKPTASRPPDARTHPTPALREPTTLKPQAASPKRVAPSPERGPPEALLILTFAFDLDFRLKPNHLTNRHLKRPQATTGPCTHELPADSGIYAPEPAQPPDCTTPPGHAS